MEKLPKLRFKEFEEEWEEKKLGDVSSIYDGTHQTPKYVEEGIKFLSVENINNFDASDKFIEEVVYEKEYKIKPQKNDILMTRIGDIGTSNVINTDTKYAFYVSLALIRCKDNISPIFLNQCIKTCGFKKELFSRTIHVAFPKKINLGEIGGCKFYVPSILEQTKIASFLALFDRKIEKQKDKLENLNMYKNGLMQKIFSQKMHFKDDNGNEFAEWEEKKLGEYLLIPEKVKAKNIDKNKLLSVKLHLKGICLNTETDTLEIGSTIYYHRKAGQFIYGKQNIFNGAFGIIPNKYDEYLSSGDIPSLDIKNINPKFLFYYMSRKSFYKGLEKISIGSGSKRVHENVLREINITIPSLQEQQKIGNLLFKLDEKINKEQERLEQLKEYKKGLLQKMFV